MLGRCYGIRKILFSGSLLVSINIAFQVFAAALIMRVEPKLHLCLAVSLCTWAIYALDRSSNSPEDEINSPERVALRSWPIKKMAALSYLAALLLALDPVILVPGIAALAYLKLKPIFLIKNLVIGLAWAVSVVGLNGWSWLVFAFMFLSVFINSVICDIRDIEGDRRFGVCTLPVLFGDVNTRLGLLIISFVMWDILPLCILSVIAILAHHLMIVSRFNELVVDGDWIIIIGISFIILELVA
jgi:4-hydroxybenzoate polyprenyltransferase